MPRYIISTRDEFSSDIPENTRDQPRQDAHAEERHEYGARNDDLDPLQRTASAPTGPGLNGNTENIEKPASRVQSDPQNGSRPFNSRSGASRRKRRSAAPTSANLYGMSELTSPWSHSRAEKRASVSIYSPTIREFNPRRQRVRLFVTCSLQWLVTVALCVGMAGCLYGYSKQPTLSSSGRHAFNALVTIFAMAIGLNVASSLRSYAQILRWRFLAYRYRTLEEFEAVMNCESLRTVFRLMLRGSRRKILPSQTQVLAFLSLAINLLLQVTIALIGFAYSIDVNPNSIELKQGHVSVLDLSTIGDNYNQAGLSYDSQGANANNYGISGGDFNVSIGSVEDKKPDFQSYFVNNESYFYRFYDYRPNTTEKLLSVRTVSATAVCKNYTVVSGGHAGYQDNDSDVYYLDENNNKGYLLIPDYASGSATWLSNSSATCGDRCTQVFVLISADDPEVPNPLVPNPLLFECTNTVGQVTNTSHYKESDKYLLPNEQARILAGAIGYSGIHFGNQSLQDHVYASGQYWSPINVPFEDGNVENSNVTIGNDQNTASYLADLLMQFSIGAIVSMDNLGPRIELPGLFPVQAQEVNVTWQWAGLILGGIVAFQFVFLIFTLSWSNRAIIRDDNYLSIAKLLQPLVAQLGDHGCLLTGDEIAEELNNVKVSYGVRVPDGFERGKGVGHVDIIYESERMPIHSRMPPGRYDGSGVRVPRQGSRKAAAHRKISVRGVRRCRKIRTVGQTKLDT